MSRADGGGQRNRLCNVGCGNQFAADRNFDPGNFDPLQEWQRQAEAQNAAPENHPPAARGDDATTHGPPSPRPAGRSI